MPIFVTYKNKNEEKNVNAEAQCIHIVESKLKRTLKDAVLDKDDNNRVPLDNLLDIQICKKSESEFLYVLICYTLQIKKIILK
jgi:hypothetical protein